MSASSISLHLNLPLQANPVRPSAGLGEPCKHRIAAFRFLRSNHWDWEGIHWPQATDTPKVLEKTEATFTRDGSATGQALAWS